MADRQAQVLQKCVECGSSKFVHAETGEVTCSSCGLVLGESKIVLSPEWRAFTEVERAARSRVGSPTSIMKADMGLSTVIQQIDRDASGRSVPYDTRLKMLRLKKWQSQSQFASSAERNLLVALSEIDSISDRLHISKDTQQTAAQIYRKALSGGLVRGRSIASMAAACLYAACRVSQQPKSLKEISAASKVTRKDVARDYRLALKELKFHVPIPNPNSYVPRIASILNIHHRTQLIANEILDLANRQEMTSGKDPKGMAAAALYMACVLTGLRVTQKDVASAAQVTEVTVRNRYRGLRQIADTLRTRQHKMTGIY